MVVAFAALARTTLRMLSGRATSDDQKPQVSRLSLASTAAALTLAAGIALIPWMPIGAWFARIANGPR
jgi:hypothetical protein